MEIVINASPLIVLSKIGQLHLLNELFAKVYIPSAVIEEVSAIDSSEGRVDLSNIVFEKLIITNQIAVLGLIGRLHQGEVEVMIGALERGTSIVVLDEITARNKAKQLGLEVTGTLGILLRAHKLELIDNLANEIEKLKGIGMYLSDTIIDKILNS